ncbi:GNAT family N-acetyltransferase [Alicyclobacillus curvatus]|nr:GNAT family N-acetyltransferase [Alicyclobacillus curvatus]
MIRRLDLLDIREISALLSVQRLAYGVEADLIGFYDIPPLKDTVQSLQSCDEIFYGHFREGELCGSISYTKQGHDIDICRLVVHPKTFRQGVGKALLEHLLTTESDASRFTVSTGQKNTPAIKLYEQKGFNEIRTSQISRDVSIIHLERKNR